MNAIAKSYWRSIQRGVRAFGAVPEAMQDAVRGLAQADVEAGTLDADGLHRGGVRGGSPC